MFYIAFPNLKFFFSIAAAEEIVFSIFILQILIWFILLYYSKLHFRWVTIPILDNSHVSEKSTEG